MFSQRLTPVIWAFALSFAFNSHAQIGKGHQLLITHGFQVQGMVANYDAFHLNTYSNANYTAIHWLWDSTPSDMGASPGFPWARWARNESEVPPLGGESSYLSKLMMIQLGDEWELNDDTTRTRLVNWFNAVRANWPNTILFHNNYGGQVGDAQLGDFITRAQPDILSFDSYPFRDNLNYSLINWYGDLRRYREHAKNNNIPFATYIQTYYSVTEGVRAPSASEMRLQHFVAQAFNSKALIDFTYNTGASSLFTPSGGDNFPNALYYEKADCALRARNFGKALVRLQPFADPVPNSYTKAMMFIRGRDSGGGVNPIPIGFVADAEQPNNYSDWVFQRYDPFLTSWAVTNKGTKNNGQPGNVIVSWFKPLDESFDGPNYTNEVYMMVVNALSDATGSAADCQQEIRLNFSNLLAVERLNPLTGLVEVQALPLTNGLRQLVLNLNGGDAVLFKFSTGAPFIGASLTGPPVITSQPTNRAVSLGSDASFVARAAGGAPLSYRWQFNGANIPGATTNTYTRTNVQVGDVGYYTMIASNSFGSVTSAPAALSIASPLLLYEPFDYTNIGGPVTDNTPANWATNGSGANDLNVTGGSLSYGGLATTVGNSVTNGGPGLGVRRLFGAQVSSGILYFSALFRMNNLGYGTWTTIGGSQVGALTATNNLNFPLAVMVKSNSPTGYVIGVQKASGTAVFDTTEHHTNETIFLVGKYNFTTAPDTATLWVNPSPSFGNESAPTNFISVTDGTDGFIIDRFNMRQNTAASVPAAMQWDELRIGTNWSSVAVARVRPSFTGFNFLPNGQLQLQGSGDAGNFAIDASTNLISWNEVTNFSSTNGIFHYMVVTTNLPRQYFRVRLAP